MKRNFGFEFKIPYIPAFILRAFTKVIIPAYNDVELCERFSSGREAIRPMIFSHGLIAEKSWYTALYHAMAASGYLVIAINH